MTQSPPLHEDEGICVGLSAYTYTTAAHLTNALVLSTVAEEQPGIDVRERISIVWVQG